MIAVFFLLLAICAYFLWLYYIENKFKQLVSFAMSPDINTEIGFVQSKLSCDKIYLVEYRNKYLKEILSAFQIDLSHRYHSGSLKKVYNMDSRDYLMASLYAYLSKIDSCDVVLGYEMYETKEDGEYVLTDFGLVFYQTLHSVMLYHNESSTQLTFIEEDILKKQQHKKS